MFLNGPRVPLSPDRPIRKADVINRIFFVVSEISQD